MSALIIDLKKKNERVADYLRRGSAAKHSPKIVSRERVEKFKKFPCFAQSTWSALTLGTSDKMASFHKIFF